MSSQADIGQQIKLLRMDMRDIKEELHSFRKEMAEIRNAISTNNKRIDGLESRLEALENRQFENTSEGKVERLEKTIAQLNLELNDRDQEMLAADLEISNLPENPGENVGHTVELVAQKLGVVLEARDIVFAERVGPRVETVVGAEGAGESARGRGRRVVVRLARRGLRDELLRSARVRRQATTADLGFAGPPRRFFLNERLTKTNKRLFYRARQAAVALGWRFTWTKRGRIYAKQGDGKRMFSIRSEDDLERVFGKAASEDETK